jgi:hypothetical protein
MKIHDIISESVILNENLNLFRTGLAGLLQSGKLGLIDDLLANFTRLVMGKSTAANELAESWILLAKMGNMGADDAINAGVKAATAEGVQASVIEAAKKQAARGIGRLPGRSKLSQAFAKAKGVKDGLGVWYMGVTNLYINTVFLFGIAEPIYEAATNIAKAYDEADAGNAQYKDNIQYIVQWEITNCTKKVMGIIAGKFVTKHLFGTVIQGIPFMGGNLMGKFWNSLGQAAQATFVTWFQTQEGQEAFAKWLVGNLLIPGTDWNIPGGQMFNDLTNWAGGWAKTGYDAILRKLDHRYAGQPAANPLEKDTSNKEIPNPDRFDYITGAPVNATYKK